MGQGVGVCVEVGASGCISKHHCVPALQRHRPYNPTQVLVKRGFRASHSHSSATGNGPIATKAHVGRSAGGIAAARTQFRCYVAKPSVWRRHRRTDESSRVVTVERRDAGRSPGSAKSAGFVGRTGDHTMSPSLPVGLSNVAASCRAWVVAGENKTDTAKRATSNRLLMNGNIVGPPGRAWAVIRTTTLRVLSCVSHAVSGSLRKLQARSTQRHLRFALGTN